MLLRFFKYWLPPLLWMLSIFFLSSQPRVTITGTFSIDFTIFKGLHMIEYAILYFLLFRAFYSLKNKNMNQQKKYIYSLIIAILYAASDEFHQTYVFTREGTVPDILIDTAGIVLLYMYIKYNLNSIKKFL